MNANEKRKHLRMVAASLMDHLCDQFDETVAKGDEMGPRYWRYVGDLEYAVGTLAGLVEKLSGGCITQRDAIETAEDCVAEYGLDTPREPR